MTTTKPRKLVTLSEETATMLDKLKKEQYYNTSYSEMLRDIITTGLAAIAQEAEHEEQ